MPHPYLQMVHQYRESYATEYYSVQPHTHTRHNPNVALPCTVHTRALSYQLSPILMLTPCAECGIAGLIKIRWVRS